MSIRDRLRDHRELGLLIERRMEHIDRIAARAVSPPPMGESKIGKGRRRRDPMGDIAAKHLDACRKLSPLIEEHKEQRVELEPRVNTLPAGLREVIVRRYFNCENWGDMVTETGESAGRIYRLHSEALARLES